MVATILIENRMRWSSEWKTNRQVIYPMYKVKETRQKLDYTCSRLLFYPFFEEIVDFTSPALILVKTTP